MMTEKDMVNDILNNINATLSFYTNAISQTENIELRSTLIQIRNQTKKSQYDLFTIAKKLNYYVPAHQASQEEIQKLKSELINCTDCSRDNYISVNHDSHSNYLSSQSNGILNHIDTHTEQALRR